VKVYIVEVYDTHNGQTLGFHPITAPNVEEIEGPAADLSIAMNHGRQACTDWRQIAEHAYDTTAIEVPPRRPAV